MKKAFITGVTGQDGSFLAEFLLGKGYEVHGMVRRSSVDFRARTAHLEGRENFHLHFGDMGDSMSIAGLISTVRPDEIYNLALMCRNLPLMWMQQACCAFWKP